MILTITMVQEGATPAIAKRELPRINKRALLVLGHRWFRKMLPKHFTRAGAAEYRYQPRKGDPGSSGVRNFWTSYQGRKQRLFGHRQPLVWSGSSRTLATGLKNITATSRRVRIRLTAPTLNRGTGDNGKPPMRDEVTRLSRRDIRELRQLYVDSVALLLRRIKTRRRRRIL